FLFFFSSYLCLSLVSVFIFIDTATIEFSTLSLHDALPILVRDTLFIVIKVTSTQLRRGLFKSHWLYSSKLFAPLCPFKQGKRIRSEEHTSELQSRFDLVCRLLLEKKKQ